MEERDPDEKKLALVGVADPLLNVISSMLGERTSWSPACGEQRRSWTLESECERGMVSEGTPRESELV